MRIRFLDREREARRLTAAVESPTTTLCCVYGRRRCGKSRLLNEVLPGSRTVYYVGDHREGSLQRSDLATSLNRQVAGFDRVEYPDWSSLLERWWKEAPAGAVLTLDEFPFMVRASPELPSLLQKVIDGSGRRARHVLLSGSSQQMMQGLVLGSTAPLYGRAREILKVEPLEAGWLGDALGIQPGLEALRAFSVWGGVPRHWELAVEFGSLWEAIESLLFEPLGVLHDEPQRLLQDDIRETAQAATILALIGRGCHRMSEIAARIGKPATSLTRPLKRLQDLGLVDREVPFGSSARGGRRSLYEIADPLLAFWFRFVEPHRSLLGEGQVETVSRLVRAEFDQHVGRSWERLARRFVSRSEFQGISWRRAERWWGAGTDGKPLEVDVVAESADRECLLVGEAKLRSVGARLQRERHRLKEKISRLPFVASYTQVIPVLFVASASRSRAPDVISAKDVLRALR